MNLSTGKLFAYALIISIIIALFTGCKSNNVDKANDNAIKDSGVKIDHLE